jgi:diketogulonate reductase-like aldo/keto reductase
MSNTPLIKLNSGHSIPILGLGTWKSTPETVGPAVKYAILDAGYRHIDCAAIYSNEPEIGAVFAEIFTGNKIKREEIFITRKLWNTEHRPERVASACKKTLHDLKLDYLDLYLIHWGIAMPPEVPYSKEGPLVTEPIPIRETWKAMEELVSQGLVKSIGVSNFTVMMLYDLITYAKIKPVMNQVEIHAYNSQTRLVEFCQKENIAVTAYSPLGRPGYKPGTYDLPKNCPYLICNDTVVGLSEKYKKTPAQILLRWLAERNIVAIPKSVTPARIDENIKIFDFSLSTDDKGKIDSLNLNFRYVDPYDWWKLGYFN